MTNLTTSKIPRGVYTDGDRGRRLIRNIYQLKELV